MRRELYHSTCALTGKVKSGLLAAPAVSTSRPLSEELDKIATCVDALLDHAGVRPKDVDRVFLTGGSSFVPAVRRIFESRFGRERLRAGNEFTSVARGLALSAAQRVREEDA